jgi:hypothetical protein
MQNNKRKKKSLLPKERISYALDEVRANDELGLIINAPMDEDVMYSAIDCLFEEQDIFFDYEWPYYTEAILIANGCVPDLVLYPKKHMVKITEETRSYCITASFTSLCGLIKGNIAFKKADE